MQDKKDGDKSNEKPGDGKGVPADQAGHPGGGDGVPVPQKGQWRDGRYYPSMDEALKWAEHHMDVLGAFYGQKVADLVDKAVRNPLGFCHSAQIMQEPGLTIRTSLIVCVVASHEKNRGVVAKYKLDNPTSSFRVSALGGLAYSDMISPAFETKKLIVLKLDEPDAVVLCGVTPSTIKHLEDEFAVQLAMVEKEHFVIGKMTPPT